MKLSELIKHVPDNQYLRIREGGHIVAIGFSGGRDIQRHLDKTTGSLYVKDGILEVNVAGEMVPAE